MSKVRLDRLLVENGLVNSRSRAQVEIREGNVTVNGITVRKTGESVDQKADVKLIDTPRYVSRGGWKLEKALDAFCVDPTGFVCSDSGASTGGFTDCLLKRGAKHVFAIDVGTNQLDPVLRRDQRVTVMEQTNIRDVTCDMLGTALDLSVVDVSFISLRLVLPVVRQLLNDSGQIICLIKPQFEVGKENVGKKGVVRDPALHCTVLQNIIDLADELSLEIRGMTHSPVKGPEGNIEYLALLSKIRTGSGKPDPNQLVADAYDELGG